jgi:hypothetical protein
MRWRIGGLKVVMLRPRSPYQIGKHVYTSLANIGNQEFARGSDFDPYVFLNYLFEVVKLQQVIWSACSLTLRVNAQYLVATQKHPLALTLCGE